MAIGFKLCEELVIVLEKPPSSKNARSKEVAGSSRYWEERAM
jgi:hypothetical protein